MSNLIASPYSLTTDGIPFTPRPCFNWLPQYRYGLFAYKALQQSCASMLSRSGSGVTFTPTSRGAADIPMHLVRPVLMDSVLEHQGWLGYVLGQARDVLQPFSNGELFHPLTPDTALIVAKEEGSSTLLNNILSYMVPAPSSVEAALALAGGYSGVSRFEIAESHNLRKEQASQLASQLRALYSIQDSALLRLHSAGVGGLIEAATRYMHLRKPGFRTCILVPEYWDFLRCVLTYSPNNIQVVDGRHHEEFPENEWLSAVCKPDIDFSYISYTNNPLGSTISRSLLLKAIDAIPNDTLFFIDCTSVDTQESSSASVIASILKQFSHKNLLITKSFSKEYNKGHLRVGYGVFTRKEVAEAMWPLMASYSPASISMEAAQALSIGNSHILEAYRKTEASLQSFSQAHPAIKVSGTASNYTSLFFSSEEEATGFYEKIAAEYAGKVYPGELPMQGGGHLGLGQGEVSLTSMKRIPFLPKNALRLLVTERSVSQVNSLL
jgi:histidinol-phosphate/aromatic aminotransferase/cobyric acid decarboxylase-like protein